MVGLASVAPAAVGRRARGRRPGRAVHGRRRGRRRGGGGVRDRVQPPRPGRAGHGAALRAVRAAGAGRRERRHAAALLGADGADVAAARARRARPARRGGHSWPLVRGDDPHRVRRDPDRIAGAGRGRRLLPRHPRSGALARGRRAGLRAVPGRVRVEGRHPAAARLAAPGPSGGAEPRVGVDVRGDGQPGRVRDRPGRARPARRRTALVVAPRAGARGGLGGLRDPAGRRPHRPQTAAGLLDHREHGPRPGRGGCERPLHRGGRPSPRRAGSHRGVAARV